MTEYKRVKLMELTMENAHKNKISAVQKNAENEAPTLESLHKDLAAYLDLHAVFHPDSSEKAPALLSIRDELGERLDTIVELAVRLHATSAQDIAKKLEIFSIAYGNDAGAVQKRRSDQLLRSIIDDLNQLARTNQTWP